MTPAPPIPISPPPAVCGTVLSLVISSHFLQMKVLYDECVEFFRSNLQAIVSSPVDTACLPLSICAHIAGPIPDSVLVQLEASDRAEPLGVPPPQAHAKVTQNLCGGSWSLVRERGCGCARTYVSGACRHPPPPPPVPTPQMRTAPPTRRFARCRHQLRPVRSCVCVPPQDPTNKLKPVLYRHKVEAALRATSPCPAARTASLCTPLRRCTLTRVTSRLWHECVGVAVRLRGRARRVFG